jgi:tRNA(Ile)-lysidine synthase
MVVAGEAYRPRFERLELLFDAVKTNTFATRTLHGCRVAPAPKPWRKFGERTLLVTREARAASRAPNLLLKPGVEAIWDNRFRLMLAAEALPGLYASALGERPEFSEALGHIPAPARAGLPALWRGKTLAAIPHANTPITGRELVQAVFIGAGSASAD